MADYSGHCHCGNLEVSLRTETPATALGLQACQCSFCVRHGARTLSDPNGTATIRVRDSSQFQRYRFGLSTADYLLCRTCGVFVAAVGDTDGRTYATVNAACFPEPPTGLAPAEPVTFESENVAERIRRHKVSWTPLVAFVICG